MPATTAQPAPSVPAPPIAQAAPPRRRIGPLRIAGWLLLAAAAAWFGRFAYLRITLRPTPRPEYWAAQLEALDPPPPGALTLNEVIPILTNRPWENQPAIYESFKWDIFDICYGEWNAARKDIQAAASIFAMDAFAGGVAKMDSALQKGWSVPHSLNPRISNTTNYRDWRAWAKTIMAHSRWVREVRGDISAASADWNRVLRLGREMRRSRQSVAWLTEIATVELVAAEMQWTAQESHARIKSLELATVFDTVLGGRLTAAEFFGGIRIAELSRIDFFAVRHGDDWFDLSEMSSVGAAKAPRAWNMLASLLRRPSDVNDRFETWIADLSQLTLLADLYMLQTKPAGTSAKPRFDVLDGPMAGSESLATVLAHYWQSRMRLDAAVTMLALAEHFRDQQSYAPRLSDLVPNYLAAVPLDLVDGKPLRYRRLDNTYVLYSIGLNMIDDGGDCNRDMPLQFDPNNPDVVYSNYPRRPVP